MDLKTKYISMYGFFLFLYIWKSWSLDRLDGLPSHGPTVQSSLKTTVTSIHSGMSRWDVDYMTCFMFLLTVSYDSTFILVRLMPPQFWNSKLVFPKVKQNWKGRYPLKFLAKNPPSYWTNETLFVGTRSAPSSF